MPTSPGLGVALDRDALARLHEQYLQVRDQRAKRHHVHADIPALLQRDAPPLVNVTGYAYPWDAIDDDAAASSAAELGVDVVALAATYHATRVVTPLHPTRRVLDVPYSAAYFPIRPDAWRDQRLQPRAPAWMASGDVLQRSRSAIRHARDWPVVAWVVVAHDDDLGATHPEVVARNAFDEPYPYSLCPSSDEVRSYCGTLVEEVMVTTASRGVVLEACGAIGVEHGSLHDKSDMAALNEAERWLLSICFCRSCRDGAGRRSTLIPRSSRERSATRSQSRSSRWNPPSARNSPFASPAFGPDLSSSLRTELDRTSAC